MWILYQAADFKVWKVKHIPKVCIQNIFLDDNKQSCRVLITEVKKFYFMFTWKWEKWGGINQMFKLI